MKKWIAALLIAVPAAALAQAVPPGATIAGGWSLINAPEKNAEVVEALAAVLALPGNHQHTAHIFRAEQQVTAGISYRLILHFPDGKHWVAIVWHKLDHSYQVTNMVPLN